MTCFCVSFFAKHDNLICLTIAKLMSMKILRLPVGDLAGTSLGLQWFCTSCGRGSSAAGDRDGARKVASQPEDVHTSGQCRKLYTHPVRAPPPPLLILDHRSALTSRDR